MLWGLDLIIWKFILAKCISMGAMFSMGAFEGATIYIGGLLAVYCHVKAKDAKGAKK